MWLHRVGPRSAQPFSVLITSSTNSAILTCLEKIAEKVDEMGLVEGDDAPLANLKIAKLANNTDTIKPHALVELLPTNKFNSRWCSGLAVVGSTPWKLTSTKLAKDEDKSQDYVNGPFDLVVIDEGSQMRVGPAAIPMRFLKQDGRLIVAGDHKQLPPIVHAEYPAPPTGSPRLDGSILECLIRDTSNVTEACPFDVDSGLGDTSPDLSQIISKLRENFRMNGALASFTHYTYGSDYNAIPENVNRKIEMDAQRLEAAIGQLGGGETVKNVIRGVFDSSKSICAVQIPLRDELSSLTAEAVADIEALMVADMVSTFVRSRGAEEIGVGVGGGAAGAAAAGGVEPEAAAGAGGGGAGGVGVGVGVGGVGVGVVGGAQQDRIPAGVSRKALGEVLVITPHHIQVRLVSVGCVSRVSRST